jgi:hypothetical protein
MFYGGPSALFDHHIHAAHARRKAFAGNAALRAEPDILSDCTIC